MSAVHCACFRVCSDVLTVLLVSLLLPLYCLAALTVNIYYMNPLIATLKLQSNHHLESKGLKHTN